jgi:nitrate reductase gamma subunit
MGYRVDPTFLQTLQEYGAQDIDACFNCGNCTAVCPHSEGTVTFPRRLIRYAQVGLKDAVAGSKELWVCYYCGECSDTCPREAEPGEFMAAARRYAVASNDPTGLSRVLYASPWANVAAFIIVTAVLAYFLLRDAGPLTGRFFEFIPGEVVHNVGVAVLVITALAILAGIINMIRRVRIAIRHMPASTEKIGAGARTGRGLWAAISEVVTQKRYRDCATEHSVPEPWYRARWFLHWSMLWGFIGLFVATAWNWLDALPDGTPVALYYPPRLIGTIAGLFFLYGTGMALWQRIRPTSKYSKHSAFSDWVLILYLFLLAVTGFALEILVYQAPATAFGNAVLLVHTILAFQLILMLPFSKLAHVFYRTLAIFIHAYYGTGEAAEARRELKVA